MREWLARAWHLNAPHVYTFDSKEDLEAKLAAWTWDHVAWHREQLVPLQDAALASAARDLAELLNTATSLRDRDFAQDAEPIQL